MSSDAPPIDPDAPDGPPSDCENDFWDDCALTVIKTDPPRYQLALPQGQTLRLTAGHFFNVAKFRVAYIEAVGAFPPLPEKKTAAFLQDLLRRLLDGCHVVEMLDEASDRGTIAEDIRLLIRAAPQSPDPLDIDRGTLFETPEGEVWVNARILLARTARSCPVKVTPASFYVALCELGLVNLGPRRAGGWQGRVWLVPASMVPSVTKAVTGPVVAALAPADPDQQGAFDDLL